MLASRARAVSVKAQAKQQPKAKVNLAKAAAAVVASVVVLASPVFAAVDDNTVRPTVCAANPTAKVCLKGSFERSQAK